MRGGAKAKPSKKTLANKKQRSSKKGGLKVKSALPKAHRIRRDADKNNPVNMGSGERANISIANIDKHEVRLAGAANIRPDRDAVAASEPEAEQKRSGHVRHIIIDEHTLGQRIDNFLLRELKGVPKSRLYRALRQGEVRVNKKRVRAEYRLKDEDIVRIPPIRVAEKTEVFVGSRLLALLEKAIIFESNDVIVVNKPSGLAVHGGSGLNYGLIEAMRKLRPDCRRLELAHRLDRDTSGCTIITKKSSVLKWIHQQLREKTMNKVYFALVKGRWPKRKTHINQPLDKNILASGERMVRVSPEGKISKTAFDIAELFTGATLLEVRPITGRTHQIRVHAQYAGFPLMGDDKYGIKDDKPWEQSMGLQRLFLHAREVSFTLPDGKRIIVNAPLPDDLEAMLQNLRRGV